MRRRRWPEEIYQRAAVLLRSPAATPTSIATSLGIEFREAPSARTITEWIQKGVIARPDPADRWTSDHADPAAARVILETLRALILDTHGGVRDLTSDEAKDIGRLRLTYPDLEPLRAFDLAQYFRRARSVESMYTVDGLTRYLAFTPWRDAGEAYLDAFARGLIREYYALPGDPSVNDAEARRAAERTSR